MKQQDNLISEYEKHINELNQKITILDKELKTDKVASLSKNVYNKKLIQRYKLGDERAEYIMKIMMIKEKGKTNETRRNS